MTLWHLFQECATHVNIRHELDSSVYDNNKSCANCSANYTLRSFGGTTEEDDVCMRIYLAQKAKRMYEGDHDWVSSDPNVNMKAFMRGAISVLLNTHRQSTIAVWIREDASKCCRQNAGYAKRPSCRDNQIQEGGIEQ